MKKDSKILELVPVDTQIKNEFIQAMLEYIDSIRNDLENGEIQELIIVSKTKENEAFIMPMTNSLSSAVGMLELAKNELIFARYMDDLIDE